MDWVPKIRDSSRSLAIGAAALTCFALTITPSPARAEDGDRPLPALPAPAGPPAAAPAAGFPSAPPPAGPFAAPPGEYSNRPLLIADWPLDEPPPSGYHWGKRLRRGPIITGSILFGVFYLSSVFIGAAGQDAGDPAYGWLYVPGLGPFVELTNSSTAVASVSLILDGAVQSGALALLIWGIVSPAPILVEDRTAAPRVLPAPMLLGKDASGFGLVGVF